MIGNYLEIVEAEVVTRGNRLNRATFSGLFKQRKLMARHQSLPEIGIIMGIDVDPQGIG